MLQETPKLKRAYSKGPYNKSDLTEQWIRISEGCPNACPYCSETTENGKEPIHHPIPEIVRNRVRITDMNLIYKPRAVEIINELGAKRVNGKVVYYELLCGVDYRFMTQELSNVLHNNRFTNIRLAWDFSFALQREIKDTLKMLMKAGYSSKKLTVFMICNWRTPYLENCAKVDLCKVWNVKVADCWFDNQTPPDIKPIHWTDDEINNFRAKVRKHNQLVNFGIDPEVPVFRKKQQQTLLENISREQQEKRKNEL